MQTLNDWGWNQHWQRSWLAQRDSFLSQDAVPGRVLSRREDTFWVATEHQLCKAFPAGSLFHRAREEERPTVGDWAIVTRSDDSGIIHTVLPRRSLLLRQAAGGRGIAQLVATNVDIVFVVIPVLELNLNRIERYLVAICAGGARPAVILSKCDLASKDEVRSAMQEVRALMPGITVFFTSKYSFRDSSFIKDFEARLEKGHTYALVGTSGAGKSTLLNVLSQEVRQATGAVREVDGKGRHITTFRELFALPSGALMIDTPGMREFALWSDAAAINKVFADIDGRASLCRFSDCSHHDEPGCSVRMAIEEGKLADRRLHNWRLLLEEIEHNSELRKKQQQRRERGSLRRKKQRDERFSKRRS